MKKILWIVRGGVRKLIQYILVEEQFPIGYGFIESSVAILMRSESQGFGAFLSELEEQWDNSNCYDMITFRAFKKALGEWAWKELWVVISLEEMYKQAKKEGWAFDFLNVQAYFTEEVVYHKVLWIIAVSCLGRAVVECRLRGAGGKK